MKKAFSLMLVFLLLLATGCVNDDDDDDNGGNGGGGSTAAAQAADYLPLAIGTQWHYTETGTDWDEPINDSFVMTVAGTVQEMGNTYSAIVEDSDSTLIRIENNIIYTINYFDEFFENDEDFEKPSAAKAAVAAAVNGVEDMAWFDFNKSAGSAWTLFENVMNMEGASAAITIVGKRMGDESVSGSFKDCPKFTLTVSSNYSYSYNNVTYESEYKSVTTFWFGKGVGIVKMSEEATESGVENESGSVYSSVTTLDSYTIPE